MATSHQPPTSPPPPTNPSPKIFTPGLISKPILHPLTPSEIANLPLIRMANLHNESQEIKDSIIAAAEKARLDDIAQFKLLLRDMSNDDDEEREDVSMVTDAEWEAMEGFIGGLGLAGLVLGKEGVEGGQGDGDEMGEAEAERWLNEVREGNGDAMAGIELLKSEWVVHFEFEDFGGMRGWMKKKVSWVVRALQIAAASQRRAANDSQFEPGGKIYLLNLKSISTNYWDTENGLSFSDILPLASLPSLETLSVFALSDEKDWVPPPSTVLSIKHLKFPYSAVTGTALGNFIACCPKLESLEYVTGGSCCGFATLEPEKLGPGLVQCRKTLKKLVLVDTEGWEVDWCQGPRGLEAFTNVMCSLKGFESLEVLECMASMVVGLTPEGCQEEVGKGVRNMLVDSLPKSLRSVHLKICGSMIVKQLDALVGVFGQTVPVLEKVHVEMKHGAVVDEVEWRGLKERLEEHSVVLTKV